MLRPNLAVADRSMNDFLRRKSLPGKVIHRLTPRGHHPPRRGQYVTVTQWCARQAHPTKTTNRHSAGIPRGGDALSDTSTCPGSNQSGTFMSSWKRADVAVAHAAPAAYELHDRASRHSHVFPDYVTFSWCGRQRVRSLSPDATRRSLLPITAAFASARICCVIRARQCHIRRGCQSPCTACYSLYLDGPIELDCLSSDICR